MVVRETDGLGGHELPGSGIGPGSSGTGCEPFAVGNTRGMKTAVSIPDDVFADAERLARQLKTSRSRLYSQALAEYIARHSTNDVTEALNLVVDEVGPSDIGFSSAAAQRVSRRVEW